VEKGKLLDLRLLIHRRVLKKELQSPHRSLDMREKLTKFLSTSTSTSTDHDNITFASKKSSDSSVIQLLSPIEKSRQVLRSYKPDDFSEGLARYRDYSYQGGAFRLSLCDSAHSFYGSDPVSRAPTDADARAHLISKLPKWTPEAIDDDFKSTVAMNYWRDLKKNDIVYFTSKDFYRYEDRFLKLLDRIYLYWDDVDAKEALKAQKDLFISGAQPRAFKTLLEKRKKALRNLDDVHLSVHANVVFARNTR
jgi:hypothetical protein